MPRQSRKREGRRDTGPIRGVIAGAISRRAPRSRVVANTAARWVPKRRKAPWSFGNRRSSRGGGGRGPLAVSLQRGGVSSPPDAEMRRPGCSRERSRRGSSPVKRRVLRSAPSARAGHGGESHRGSRGSLSPAGFSCAQACGGSAQAEGRGVTWVRRHRASGGEKEAAGLSQFTGEDRLLEGCARASVSCCRSRQASPGPEKREHGPLLTERPIHVDGV
jgi:hypothetical protein